MLGDVIVVMLLWPSICIHAYSDADLVLHTVVLHR